MNPLEAMHLSRRGALGAIGIAAAVAPAAGAATSAGGTAPIAGPSLLYPHESRTRTTRELGGLWRFRLDPDDAGERGRWFDGLTTDRRIPVPCSWNDLFDDAKDYQGVAWYETEFALAAAAAAGADGDRVVLRFGSVAHHARVWLNGAPIGEHEGPHLPFALDATDHVVRGGMNRLVVRVENLLRPDRIPPVPTSTQGMTQQDFPQTAYDFFPYSGIHRPVLLCTWPMVHLHDVGVTTTLNGGTGGVTVAVTVAGGWTGPVRLTLEGGPRPIVAEVAVRQGQGQAVLRVPGVRPWSPDDPFLYRLTIAVGGARAADAYSLKIGVRTVMVEGSRLLLNGKPVQLRGFGKHEDFPLHGRGLDLAALVRDFELLKWVGANSFRTSHYPYAEETLMLADEHGLLVVAETAAVGLIFADAQDVVDRRQAALAADLTRMIARDRNHPSVILWSLANEPLAKPYRVMGGEPDGAVARGERFFAGLFQQARALDPTRPIAIVTAGVGPAEWARLGDVVCANIYDGWYNLPGQLDQALERLERDLATLRQAHGDKPIFITEFGADAIAGLHAQPAEMWTEEYQAEMVTGYLDVFARHPEVIGTHPWAFADFKTSQSVGRVGGLNFKGVFTRDRRPKLVAHRLRARWRR